MSKLCLLAILLLLESELAQKAKLSPSTTALPSNFIHWLMNILLPLVTGLNLYWFPQKILILGSYKLLNNVYIFLPLYIQNTLKGIKIIA